MSRTISNADKALHMQTAPTGFQRRGSEAITRQSHAQLDAMLVQAESLTKADAIRLAQTLLVHVYSDGIGYDDVQSSQAVERYVAVAIRALRGLALS